MAKAPTGTLVALYNNLVLRAKVEEALDNGTTYDDIVKLGDQYGTELSKSAITRYKQRREEAKEKGIPTGALIAGTQDWKDYMQERIDGKKAEKLVEEQKAQEAENERVEASRAEAEQMAEEPYDLPEEFSKSLIEDVSDDVTPRTFTNDLTVLDEIINKGLMTIQQQDGVDPKVTIKAIELKGKLTDGNLKGMTIEGIKALEARQKRLSYILTDVLMKYVPQEKQDAATKDLEKAEEAFNRNLNLDENYKALKHSLEAGGVNIDEV